jgi:hypothetical protein
MDPDPHPEKKSCCGSASGTGWIRIRILMDPHPDLDGSALFWILDLHPDSYPHKIKKTDRYPELCQSNKLDPETIRINFQMIKKFSKRSRVVDPDPHCFGNLNPHSNLHQHK